MSTVIDADSNTPQWVLIIRKYIDEPRQVVGPIGVGVEEWRRSSSLSVVRARRTRESTHPFPLGGNRRGRRLAIAATLAFFTQQRRQGAEPTRGGQRSGRNASALEQREAEQAEHDAADFDRRDRFTEQRRADWHQQ